MLLLSEFLPPHQILLDIACGIIMILVFLAQIHQHMPTTIRIHLTRCRIKPHIRLLLLMTHTMIVIINRRAINPQPLLLPLRLDLPSRLANQRLIKLLLIFPSYTILNYTLAIVSGSSVDGR